MPSSFTDAGVFTLCVEHNPLEPGTYRFEVADTGNRRPARDWPARSFETVPAGGRADVTAAERAWAWPSPGSTSNSWAGN